LPWNLYLGIGYTIDTVAAPPSGLPAPAAHEVRTPPPVEYHVLGTVSDEDTSQPIARALIQFDRPEYTGLISRINGTFDSGKVKPGNYRLLVTAEGYKDATCAVRVPSNVAENGAASAQGVAQNTAIACSLKPAPALGILHGTLVDADSSSPITQAAIKVKDERDRLLELQSNDAGSFRVDNVPAGQVQVAISAVGYLPTIVTLEIQKKVEQHAALVLHKLPKKPNVTVTPKELKLFTQIRFDATSAEISPSSRALVQEIAATLQQRPELTSVEIQVYTDEFGSAPYNKRLSEQRAGMLRGALMALGVDSARLTASGFGSEKPLAPNVDEANRAKNQRVRLVILRRE
jgi:outer membrane protein OmpA-like peptidoglycan-associated protein